jgi:hypothetical protein
MVVTSGFYVWVFWRDTRYDSWACKVRDNFRSFFDSKSAFYIVMTKEHKSFSSCNWPLQFQCLLYVPPTLELSIALYSVRTNIFACPICFLQERKLIITHSFISVRQTQLLLCYNYLKDRVSVSYDYMFLSFFDHPQVYKSYILYILAVQLSVYLTNGIPLVSQFITVSLGLK